MQSAPAAGRAVVVSKQRKTSTGFAKIIGANGQLGIRLDGGSANISILPHAIGTCIIGFKTAQHRMTRNTSKLASDQSAEHCADHLIDEGVPRVWINFLFGNIVDHAPQSIGLNEN